MTTTIDLNEAFDPFIETVNRFSALAFIQKPALEGWSAAEVAEHIGMINTNLIRVLQVTGEKPDRAPDKKVAVLTAALQDRETKRVAPANLTPTGTQKDPALVIAALKQQKDQLQKIAVDMDMQELCTVYPHPRLGRLTRLEWFHFMAKHTERHRQQLLQIIQALPLS